MRHTDQPTATFILPTKKVIFGSPLGRKSAGFGLVCWLCMRVEYSVAAFSLSECLAFAMGVALTRRRVPDDDLYASKIAQESSPSPP